MFVFRETEGEKRWRQPKPPFSLLLLSVDFNPLRNFSVSVIRQWNEYDIWWQLINTMLTSRHYQAAELQRSLFHVITTSTDKINKTTGQWQQLRDLLYWLLHLNELKQPKVLLPSKWAAVKVYYKCGWSWSAASLSMKTLCWLIWMKLRLFVTLLWPLQWKPWRLT